jgi:hypothetical protein
VYGLDLAARALPPKNRRPELVSGFLPEVEVQRAMISEHLPTVAPPPLAAKALKRVQGDGI